MAAGHRASPILAAFTGAATVVLLVIASGRTGSFALGPISIGFHDYLKPLAWGAAAATALLIVEWQRAPWRRVAITALVILGALGLVNFATYAAPIVTDGDIAVSELYVELATRVDLLVGPYSRFGWHHPGPLFFYLVAPFYALGGHQAAAMYGAALAINIAALVAITWILARETPAPVATTVAGVIVLFAWRVPRFLASPWTAHVPILASLAFLVITAAVASGRLRLLPLMIGLGSFAVQTHVGFAPVVFAITAGLTGGVIWAHRRGGPSPWPALNASAWVFALLWLMPISEALSSGGGNLTALWRFFVTEPAAGHSIGEAIAYGSYGLTGLLRPDLELPWGGHIELFSVSLHVAAAIIETVLLAIVARHHFAKARRFEGCLALVALTATAISIWGLSRVRGDILNHEVFKLSAIGALNLGILAAAGFRLTMGTLNGRVIHPVLRRMPYALVLFVAMMVGVRDLESLTSFERRQQARSAIVPAFTAVRDYAAAESIRRPLIRVGLDRWGEAAGVLLRLLQNGTQAAVMSDSVSMFTNAFAATGEEDALVTFADLELHRELREKPETSILLSAFPLFVDAVKTPPIRRDGTGTR
jgi:hypothetical protein